MSMLEENKELARRFFNEVMNPGNLDAIGEFLDPNSFLIGFMRKFVAERVTGMPDAQTKVEELFGEDDEVTVCATMTGTNSGAMLGHPPTNNRLPLITFGYSP